MLKIDGRETTWQVVGLVKGILTSVPPIPFVYANYPYYARVVRHVGRAGSVQVVTKQHDADFQSEVAKALEERFKRAGLRVSSKFTTAERRTALETAFSADLSGALNPYGDGKTVPRILSVLTSLPEREALMHKRFIDIEVPGG